MAISARLKNLSMRPDCPVHIVPVAEGARRLKCDTCGRDMPQDQFTPWHRWTTRHIVVLYPTCLACKSRAANKWVYDPLIGPKGLMFIERLVSATRARSNARSRAFTLLPADVCELFVRQKGLCALTGERMYLQAGRVTRTKNAMSIDRIDSSRGYTKDNIQLVRTVANIAKGAMTDDEFLTLCKQVVVHRAATKAPDAEAA